MNSLTICGTLPVTTNRKISLEFTCSLPKAKIPIIVGIKILQVEMFVTIVSISLIFNDQQNSQYRWVFVSLKLYFLRPGLLEEEVVAAVEQDLNTRWQ